MLELFTVGQVLNCPVFIFNYFGLLQEYYMLKQWHGIRSVISILIESLHIDHYTGLWSKILL